jgi:transcriptional regulator with XRE-family HTH domain
MTEQAPLFGEELPVYQEDLERLKKKRKDFQNQLPEQINRLMNFNRVEASHIYKATGISASTLSGWINATTELQMLDDSIKKVARFFDVSVDYLGYGTPVSERDFEVERAMEEFEEKNNKQVSA